MNKTEHLLTILNEECGEAIQEACKAIRFGLSDVKPGQPDDNKRRLERELAQVMAMAELLGLTIRAQDKAEKIKKVRKYMGYSKGLGTLK
jgi:NTP pyrophosphatase (non-canonical NTP hydrolase)